MKINTVFVIDRPFWSILITSFKKVCLFKFLMFFTLHFMSLNCLILFMVKNYLLKKYFFFTLSCQVVRKGHRHLKKPVAFYLQICLSKVIPFVGKCAVKKAQDKRALVQKCRRQKSATQMGTIQKGANQIRITSIIIFHNTLSPGRFSIMDSMIQ